MWKTLVQSWPTLLALVAIASLTNCVIYFIFRAVESKSRNLSILFSAISITFWVYFNSQRLSDLIPFVFISLFGALFHLKSGAASKSFICAFWVMYAVSLIGTLLTDLISASMVSNRIFLYVNINEYASIVFRIWETSQSLTAPFLIWIWKSSRLRPGIDKPLSD
ncbi:MAG TPA: hypothetical protein VF627_01840 [Abditibacterium sp.]|jgi:hypothetical protein